MKTTHFSTPKRVQKVRREEDREQKHLLDDPVFIFLHIRTTLEY